MTRRTLVFACLLAAASAAATPLFAAESDAVELVQSELNYLYNPDQIISAKFTDASPALVYKTIGEASGITIEIAGTFPQNARVSIDVEKQPLRQCLLTLAEKLHVDYQVRDAKRLVVIVPAQASGNERARNAPSTRR